MTWTEFAPPDPKMTVGWELQLTKTIRAEVVYFMGDWYFSLYIGQKTYRGVEYARTLEQAQKAVLEQAAQLTHELLEGLQNQGLAA